MLIQSIHSILEGEGPNAGIPMLCLRVAGCSAQPKCNYCDQPDALDARSGKEYSVEQLLETVRKSKHQWVMATGGEPLLYTDELGALVFRLPQLNWEVNTNGIMRVPNWFSSVKTWIVDNKVPSSGTSSTKIDKWIKMLRPQDCQKFVVRTEGDLEFALKNRIDCCQNLVSPVIWNIREDEGTGAMIISGDQARWNQRVAEFCLEYSFRLSMQQHVLLWGQGKQDK